MTVRRLAVSLFLMIPLALVTTGTASASHDGRPIEERTYDKAEQCISDPANMFHLPTCSSVNGGKWVARFDEPGSPGGGAFGTFIALAIFWSTVPAVIAGMIASQRGQSVGLAVLLGIVLGWIGLIIVAVTFKPEVASAAHRVIERAGRPSEPERPPTTHRDTASRLAELDDLKARGLVSDQEHASRREQIIREI